MRKCTQAEVFLWSIALPGFGQLLNGKVFKSLLLVSLEFLINSQANLNEIIIFSFHGEIGKSISQTNYQWLMFYPCVYIFGIWDAYKDAGGGKKPFAAIPFAFGAYFGTVGIIFSADCLGPVWLGIIGLSVGIVIGLLIKVILSKKTVANQRNS